MKLPHYLRAVPSPEQRSAAARAFAPAIAQALDAGDAAWAERMGERDARKAVVPVRMPTRPSLEEMVRQYWRWAAWARPGPEMRGIPEGFEESERPSGI